MGGFRITTDEAFNFWKYYQGKKAQGMIPREIMKKMLYSHDTTLVTYFAALSLERISREIWEELGATKEEAKA